MLVGIYPASYSSKPGFFSLKPRFVEQDFVLRIYHLAHPAAIIPKPKNEDDFAYVGIFRVTIYKYTYSKKKNTYNVSKHTILYIYTYIYI